MTTFNENGDNDLLIRRRPTTDDGDEPINDIAPTHKDDYMWILGDDDDEDEDKNCCSSSKPSAGAGATPTSRHRQSSSRRNYREARPRPSHPPSRQKSTPTRKGSFERFIPKRSNSFERFLKRSASDMSQRRQDIMNDWINYSSKCGNNNDESQIGGGRGFETLLFD